MANHSSCRATPNFRSDAGDWMTQRETVTKNDAPQQLVNQEATSPMYRNIMILVRQKTMSAHEPTEFKSLPKRLSTQDNK